MAVCQCGTCQRCVKRRAQARYQRTEKGRATIKRYAANPAKRVIDARYRSTEKYHRVNDAANKRRIFVGHHYRGKAQSVEAAAAINAHIKERVSEFKQRFSNREETEGDSSRQVSPEAAV